MKNYYWLGIVVWLIVAETSVFAQAEEKFSIRPHGMLEFVYADNIMNTYEADSRRDDVIVRPSVGVEIKLPYSRGKLYFNYLFSYSIFTGEAQFVEDQMRLRGQQDRNFFRQTGTLLFDLKIFEDLKFTAGDNIYTQTIDLSGRDDILTNRMQVNAANAGLGWEHYWADRFRTGLRYDFIYSKALDPTFKAMDSYTHIPRFNIGWRFMPEIIVYGGYQATMYAFIEKSQTDVTIHQPFVGVQLGFTDRIVGSIEGGLSVTDRKLPGSEYPETPPDQPEPKNTRTGERLAIGLSYLYYEKNTINFRLNSSVMPDAYGVLNRSMNGGLNINYKFWGRILASLDGNFKRFGSVEASSQNTAFWGGPTAKWEFYKDSYLGVSYSYYQFQNLSETEGAGDFTSNLASLFVDVLY